MFKAYFIIHKRDNIVTGVCRFPIENLADYKNIEVMMTEQEFNNPFEIFVYQDGIVRRVTQ